MKNQEIQQFIRDNKDTLSKEEIIEKLGTLGVTVNSYRANLAWVTKYESYKSDLKVLKKSSKKIGEFVHTESVKKR